MSTKSDRLGEWCLATYHFYNHVELHFVMKWDGRPSLEFHPVSMVHDAYRWNSYHAAAKFKRENPSVAGYIIVNLAEMKAQCQAQAKIDAELPEDVRAEIWRRADRKVV